MNRRAKCAYRLFLWWIFFSHVGGLFHKRDVSFVIISAPQRSTIGYTRVGTSGEVFDLINAGLQNPEGLAVDNEISRLYVADSKANAIYGYKLLYQSGSLIADQQMVITSNNNAKWVTVNSAGDLFLTNDLEKKILVIKAVHLHVDSITETLVPEVVFNGASVPQVSTPGGIATDSTFVFWANKKAGTSSGSVVRGLARRGSSDKISMRSQVKMMTHNTAKSFGVCASSSNVFYTDEMNALWGFQKNSLVSEAVVKISSVMKKPRGCVWDNDGTIYVADKEVGRVYSFPANMPSLMATDLTPVCDFEDAFGVAVFATSSAPRFQLLLAICAWWL